MAKNPVIEEARSRAVADYESGLCTSTKLVVNDPRIKIEYIKSGCPHADIRKRVMRVLPMNALNAEELAKARTFYYHEGGHLLHTEDLGKDTPEGALHGICNSLEDVRIEAALGREHEGLRIVFHEALDWGNKLVSKQVSDGSAKERPLWEATCAMMFMARGVKPIWTLSETAKRYVELTYEDFTRVSECRNIHDVLHLAKIIYKKLMDDKQKPEEDEEPKDGESSKKSKKSKKGDKSEKSEKPGKKSDKKDKGDKADEEGDESEGGDEEGDEEGEESEGEGEKSDKKGKKSEPKDEDGEGDEEDGGGSSELPDEDDDSEDAEGSGEGEDSDEESDEKGDAKEDGKSEKGGSGSDEESDEAGDEGEEGDETKAKHKYDAKDTGTPDKPGKSPEEAAAELDKESEGKDMYEEISEELSKHAAMHDGEYSSVNMNDVFSVPETGRDDMARFTADFQKVSTKALALSQSLEQAIRTLTACRKTGHQPRGKLDTKRLASLVAGTDNRVFWKKEQGMALDVSVTILVDESGSMEHSMHEVRPLAMLLGEALDAIHVPFEMVGHSTTTMFAGDEGEFDRTIPLQIDIFKTFNESWKNVRTRTVHLRPKNQNVDGEALDIAVRRVSTQKTKRKIVFVLSDGEPHSGHGNNAVLGRHLRKVCRDARAKGIQIVAVSLMTDAPSAFYGKEHSIVINSLDTLGNDTIKLLCDTITKGTIIS
jgi:hypothetical protein